MTYSLIAFDPDTKRLGSLVASRWTSVGSCVPYIRQGIGLVHSQHCAHPRIAEACLDALEQGHSLADSLSFALKNDSNRESRQLLLANFKGDFAHYTGSDCRPVSVVAQGTYCVSAGNMIVSDQVITNMVEHVDTSFKLPFVERLLGCFEAAESAGGDLRGRESVSLRVFDPAYPLLTHFLPDLRVDNHDSPGEELLRLYQCFLSEERSITQS